MEKNKVENKFGKLAKDTADSKPMEKLANNSLEKDCGNVKSFEGLEKSNTMKNSELQKNQS